MSKIKQSSCIILGLIIICNILVLFHFPNKTFKKMWASNTVDRKVSIPINQSHGRKYKGIFGQVKHMDLDFKYSRNLIPHSIAIGIALTSHLTKWNTTKNILSTFPLVKTFLPSFCKTASKGFQYHFFLAYDKNDLFFTNETNQELFSNIIFAFTESYCTNSSKYSVHLVKCAHNGEPTRAQNDAMMEAYMSNMEYYFRINDDTHMNTNHWSEIFIDALKAFDPPNVGVVGPRHFGGNENILTYDFVHITHINIHGTYYPRVFKDWYADDWITEVYRPYRSQKLANVVVHHTQEIGTRYTVKGIDAVLLQQLVNSGMQKILRYISFNRAPIKITGTKIISMSLSGSDPRNTYGAIRNAQLLPIYFPGWTLRLYIPPKNIEITKYHRSIPKVVLDKLKLLGVQLVHVKPAFLNFQTSFWKYLVIDDINVKYFIVKDPDSRIFEKEKLLTDHWIINKQAACLCLRDVAKQTHFIVDTFMGGKTPIFTQILGLNIEQLLTRIGKNRFREEDFLNAYIWPRLGNAKMCYDNTEVSKDDTLDIPFYIKYIKRQQFGARFDEFDQTVNYNIAPAVK